MSTFLSTRETVAAKDLRGPRIYSTDLFPALHNSVDADTSVAVTARALKVKIITKGLVTMNAAYLLSPPAVRLLETHPDLLDGPAILPAFREDKDKLVDLRTSNEDLAAAGIDEDRFEAHVARLEAGISRAMPWSLAGIDDKFRTLLLDGFAHPGTLLLRELRSAGFGDEEIASVRAGIESVDLSNSLNLRQFIGNLGKAAQNPLNRYSAACYHMIGTGVVQCEAGTDLNPLSAFRSADLVLAGRDSEPEALSEEALFTEAFMGYALSTISAKVLPTAIIDAMDFRTIHQLSEALRQQGFQDKYDGVIRQYLMAAGLPDAREALDALDAEHVGHVAAELAQEFQTSILAEIPNYQTRIEEAAAEELIKTGADIAKDFANAVPGLSTVISFADGVHHAAKAVTAYKEKQAVGDLPSAIAKAEDHRAEKIKAAIENLSVSDEKRSTLLDAVAVMSDVYGIAIARA